jgi:hypothetical protein
MCAKTGSPSRLEKENGWRVLLLESAFQAHEDQMTDNGSLNILVAE